MAALGSQHQDTNQKGFKEMDSEYLLTWHLPAHRPKRRSTHGKSPQGSKDPKNPQKSQPCPLPDKLIAELLRTVHQGNIMQPGKELDTDAHCRRMNPKMDTVGKASVVKDHMIPLR